MPKRKKVTQNEVADGLRQLAFGDISDAVSLLFESDDVIAKKLKTLNLFNVSEVKRPRGGGMEIKFFDRLKAIDRLNEMAQGNKEESSVSLYEALQKSAEAIRGKYGGDYDE